MTRSVSGAVVWLLAIAACGSSSSKLDPSPVDAGARAPVDSSAGSNAPDAACVGETLAALCTTAGFTCGDASFTDRCGAPVTGTCGTCNGGVCGGADGPHVCTPAQWEELTWPSSDFTTIHASWSSPGSSQVWAGGGNLGAGELWLLEDFQFDIIDTPSAISGIHAAGGDVWAVGLHGDVVHGDATGFSLMPSTELQIYNLSAVWGFAPDDVWVATQNGVNSIAHWDGKRWALSQLPTTDAVPGCTGMWAAAHDDLWAVCQGGEIVHWDGAAWAKVPSPAKQNLEAIYGFAANDIWAVGDGDTLLHWNGTSWRAFSVPSGGGGLFGVWGAAPDDVYAVGTAFPLNGHAIHFDGNTWTEVLRGPRESELDRIAGAQGQVFAFGTPSALLTFPGLPGDALHAALAKPARHIRLRNM